MKQLVIILVILFKGLQLFAQQEKGYVKKGNDLYQQQKYKEAESNYRKAVEKKNQNIEGNFNLGDALYKQKQFAQAGEQFNKITSATNNNKTLAARAYHNLGNSLLENKKLEESIEAYKKALINNPADDETRYNLAYAQEKLKQQQQDKKKQDDKNKDKKNKDDKNKDDNNQDKKDQDQNKKDQQKQQPDKISKEDAERMLEALNNDEKQTQDKLKNKKLQGAKLKISKDW